MIYRPNRQDRFPTNGQLRSPESRELIPTDKIYTDIDRVMVSFFRNLSGDDDRQMAAECFVVTDESKRAEASLARISEELRNRIETLDVQTGSGIVDIIERVAESRRNEFVLLVGTKGAGKSTFIDRFFRIVLPAELAKQCVIIRVDLADCGCDEKTITAWLDTHLLQIAEDAIFEGKPPSYEQLMGMYFGEYKRLAEGPRKQLHDRDINQFKEEFGKLIEDRRERRPNEYIANMLRRSIRSEKKVPCLVFDNADHFTIEFQERVFQYAHSFYSRELCLVIVPITDKTSWQLSRQGALQSFFSESFFLPTPTAKTVLLKRIEYIERQLSQEQPERGEGYFFGKGIKLSLDNLRSFTNCLQDLFIRQGKTADWIGNLANADIRRCLELTRQTITSPHIRVHELLKAYFTKSNLTVNFEDVKRGIICGRYDIYPVGDHQFVQNVFALTHEVDASPLLGLRILRCLSDARFIDAEGKSHFIETERVLEYFATIGVSAHCTRRWLDVMLKCGLIWSYDPTSRSVDQAKQIEISPCGLHHLAWGTTDWVYLESMSIVTPISDASTFQQMECYFNSGSTSARRLAIVKFIENAIREDKQVCLIPQHETFAGQHELIVQLQAVAAELKGRIVSKSESRFFANDLETGRVVSWKDEGYGFVRSDRLPSDAFLHISQVLDKNITELAPGTVVAFQPEEKEKGFRATHVVIVN